MAAKKAPAAKAAAPEEPADQVDPQVPADAPVPDTGPAPDEATSQAAAPDNHPESEAAPGAATSAAPDGAGGDQPLGYRVLRPIRHGVKDEQGKRVSRIYRPGDVVQLDDDAATVLLVSGDLARLP